MSGGRDDLGNGSTDTPQRCQRFLWIFGGSAIVVGAISQGMHDALSLYLGSHSRDAAIVVLRIYNLWDTRKRVANALIYAFVACIGSTVIIGVLCELQLQRTRFLLLHIVV